MRFVDRSFVEHALRDDRTTAWLDASSKPGDEALVCQKWLRDTPPKRAIWQTLYGDILEDQRRLAVLDVGGGQTALTPVLARRHNYKLVDILAHDDLSGVGEMERRAGTSFVIAEDWFSAPKADYDLVVANDLFPNVDQRLDIFLDMFLPRTRRLRLSLTFYEEPRWYATKRIGADEVLYLLAWNGFQVRRSLAARIDAVVNPDLSMFDRLPESVYPNGRQICLVEFQGGRSGETQARDP